VIDWLRVHPREEDTQTSRIGGQLGRARNDLLRLSQRNRKKALKPVKGGEKDTRHKELNTRTLTMPNRRRVGNNPLCRRERR
jgi:hypothetical protein